MFFPPFHTAAPLSLLWLILAFQSTVVTISQDGCSLPAFLFIYSQDAPFFPGVSRSLFPVLLAPISFPLLPSEGPFARATFKFTQISVWLSVRV